MNLKKDFGKRIKELRIKKGITQYQLAELVNIDPKHISHIETGRSFPKADLIEKFAKALDTNYTELFKIEHFEDRETIINNLYEILKKANDEELKVIYKFVNSFLN